VLAQVPDIDPAFMDKPPHETRLNIHPNRHFINREKPINGNFRFGHHSSFLAYIS
jgi:hypothetical protein